MQKDDIFIRMRNAGKIKDYKEKGNVGEEAVLELCLALQSKIGGLIYTSFTYPYQTKLNGSVDTGNIKLENGKFVEYTDSKKGMYDEIDILYVTDYRIFAIEVKSYHAKINVYDHWFKKNNQDVDKSPICQAEKHVRHLYRAISSVVPKGNPNYIIPICVFVDKCTIIDERSIESARYVPISILNNFKKTIVELNTPLQYNIDLDRMKIKLKEVKTSVKQEFY